MKFPKTMGILNVTPDSFSDGGAYIDIDLSFNHAKEMIEQGAEIIDIGGESSRPGADDVSIDEEINRVIPVIKKIKKYYPNIILSIDTVKYEVAKIAIDNGVSIINDISGLTKEPRLAELAAETDSTLVIMHIQGTPKTMQNNPQYDDVVKVVYDSLEEKIAFARTNGVNKIIADVGIGFGKTFEQNWELLRRHNEFEKLEVPLLLGISRKAFIGSAFDIQVANDRDLETIMINSLMLTNKIDIWRVHNVKMTQRLKKAYELLKK